MVTKDNYFRIILNYVFLACGPTLVIASFYVLYYYLKFRNFIDPLIWRMPVAFLILGLITIVLTILACCGFATEYGLTSLVYFLLIILVIGLEIGLGAYWVHIQPDYPPVITAIEQSTTVSLYPTHNTKVTIPSNKTTVLPTSLAPDPDESTTESSTSSSSVSTTISTTAKTPPPFDRNEIRWRKNKTSPYLPNASEDSEVIIEAEVDLEAFDGSPEWRSLQLTFKCCGMNGAKDFMDKGEGIPLECCTRKVYNFSKVAVCELPKKVQKGCLEVLLVRLYMDRLLLGTLSIISGSLTLIILVTSFFIRYEEESGMDIEDEDIYTGDEFCPPSNCRRLSQTSPINVVPNLQICATGPGQQQQQQRPQQPQSPPCCRKYPPCQCAPKLRQC